MKVIPLGDKIVLRRESAEETTAGGIVLPDTAKEKPQQGRVLSVGDGKLLATGGRAKPRVAEGDRVLFARWGGTEVQVDGEELFIIGENEILAILQ